MSSHPSHPKPVLDYLDFRLPPLADLRSTDPHRYDAAWDTAFKELWKAGHPRMSSFGREDAEEALADAITRFQKFVLKSTGTDLMLDLKDFEEFLKQPAAESDSP